MYYFDIWMFFPFVQYSSKCWCIFYSRCHSGELRLSIGIDLHSHYSCWWLIKACSCCIIFAISICYK
ncbi:hypothetical protein T12_3848 [Trichinella patagoniensis]|uniref:Uncharacterized protein n=1 Tax=Trichinella patagoniensis TaxID=990121 RepID=A0A0V0Z8X1_9BILA|nr:hypothetical protein T12_3848 [Trichinella patagoniensis]